MVPRFRRGLVEENLHVLNRWNLIIEFQQFYFLFFISKIKLLHNFWYFNKKGCKTSKNQKHVEKR